MLIDPIPSGGPKPPHPVLPLGLSLIAGVAVDFGAKVSVVHGHDYEKQVFDYLKKYKPRA